MSRKRILLFVCIILALFAVILQLMVLDITGTFKIGDGLTVSQALDMGTIVSQRVFCSVFGLIMVPVSLAVAMSDEWRQAAFKYREAASRMSGWAGTSTA